MKRFFKVVNNYVVFFLVVGFAVTCCLMLFVNTLANTMGLTFNEGNIAAAAKITFGNVLLITILFGTSDYIRRRITVDRPVKKITDATEQIMQGDFSVRVPPMQGSAVEGFHRIGLAINQMAAELGSVETLRTDFIANVSHEMKTPLAVMQNYGTMLQQPDLEDAQRIEYAKAITDSSRRLADMMTNILKLNRLEISRSSRRPRNTTWANNCVNVFSSTKTFGSAQTLKSKRILKRMSVLRQMLNYWPLCGTTCFPMPSSSPSRAAQSPWR